jgi:ACR3 family arsenite efflux pump ArsB
MNAETLMTVGGVFAFGITLYWVRRRELREKYAAAWVALASLILVVGLFPGLLMFFAAEAHLSYPAAVLFIALTLIYLFAFAVSVSLTTQYRRNVRLTQELALLEERLRRLETAARGPDGPSP